MRNDPTEDSPILSKGKIALFILIALVAAGFVEKYYKSSHKTAAVAPVPEKPKAPKIPVTPAVSRRPGKGVMS